MGSVGWALARGEPRGWEWGQERGRETGARRAGQALAGTARRWLSRLKAGTPRTSAMQPPRGRVVWQPRVEVKGVSSQQVDGSPVPTVGSL